MTSSESEDQVPTRKRSRKGDSTEDVAGKKARGRPRVDTQDATAADRRRTQIRLAQRAYRQRKETTISSLKTQSTQLHSIIEQMNKTFQRLDDSARKSGLLQLNAALAQEFKLVAETFAGLAKTASEGRYDDDEHGDPADQDGSGQRSPEAQHVGWGYSAMTSSPTKADTTQQTQIQPDHYITQLGGAYGQAGTTNSLARRHQFTIGDVLGQSRASLASPHQQSIHNSHSHSQLPFGLVDLFSQDQAPFTPSNPHIYSVNIPTPDVTPPTTRLSTPPIQLPSISTKTLAPVTTYSFDETTFARRLTRAAIETGFQLLSAANVRPAALNYVFKLSLPYLNLDQLRTRFKLMLSRSINEHLDWWETPFIHLGGAGTHYPRKDASGNVIPIKNGWTVRRIGPLEKRMTRLESVEDGRWEELDGVDLSGFDGEWFDAHDVQGYLEEQYACKLDPRSSFAECQIEDESEVASNSPSLQPQYDGTSRRSSEEDSESPSLAHSTSNSSTSSSTSITPSTNAFNLPDAPFGLDMSFNHAPTPNYPSDFSKLVNYDISFDQTLGLDLAPGFDYGFAGTNGYGMDMDMPLDLIEVMPVVRQKSKKTAWVDVNRLIDEIIKHGVCLGRAPGFRRKDVDMALQKALVSTY